MKKVLIILGIVAAAGFLLLIVIILAVVAMVHRAEGPALYSSVGAWTRIDEFAHEQGKTNYIAFADNQLAELQKFANGWSKTASASEISKCEKSQADAYAMTDKNIKNGVNPLAYLDMTNAAPAATSAR